MGDVEVVLERHEQRIKTLERDMADMKEVQAEIRTMNETLVTLATELKHTNEHLSRHEKRIDEMPVRDMLLDLAVMAIKTLFENLFTKIPVVSQILQFVDIYQAMFYTVSKGDVPGLAFGTACDYIDDRYKKEIKRLKNTGLDNLTPEEYLGFKAIKRYRRHLTVIKAAVDVASWLVEWSTMPILADIELGRKISSKAYDSYIVIGDAEINFEQIANSYNPMTS
jgi:hypothetical protein